MSKALAFDHVHVIQEKTNWFCYGSVAVMVDAIFATFKNFYRKHQHINCTFLLETFLTKSGMRPISAKTSGQPAVKLQKLTLFIENLQARGLKANQ